MMEEELDLSNPNLVSIFRYIYTSRDINSQKLIRWVACACGSLAYWCVDAKSMKQGTKNI